MSVEPILELDDIQGNTLPGFRKDHQHFIFLQIDRVAEARAWLRSLAPRLSSAREVADAHDYWKRMRNRLGRPPDNVDFLFVNCALTADALRKLDIAGVEEFDDAAFRTGLEARAELIGDPAPGSRVPGEPGRWLVGSGKKVPDVLLILASDDPKWLADSEQELIEEATANGLRLLHLDRGVVRPGELAGHEHFGFKDGISLPAVRGRASAAEDDFFEARSWPSGEQFDELRRQYAGPGRQLVWPGHFLFGYDRQLRDEPESNRPHSSPRAPAWARNGSFVVYRRLQQDVQAFHAFLESSTEKLRAEGYDADLTPTRLGALLVGRWPSGWPVMRDPRSDRSANHPGSNHFSFAEATTVALPDDHEPLNPPDPLGRICPFAAHIRKVQPRDDPTDIGPKERTFQKLLLRRGITYGPEMQVDPSADRGLLFVSYQSSIVDQFEFLMNDWVNERDKPQANGGMDPIIGTARNVTIPLPGPEKDFRIDVPGGWVTATGGSYLFSPGIRFFATL